MPCPCASCKDVSIERSRLLTQRWRLTTVDFDDDDDDDDDDDKRPLCFKCFKSLLTGNLKKKTKTIGWLL